MSRKEENRKIEDGGEEGLKEEAEMNPWVLQVLGFIQICQQNLSWNPNTQKKATVELVCLFLAK